MCGLVGIFDTRGHADVDRDLLTRMNDRQLHRGPDESGIHIEPGIGLAHRRLSIIDIEAEVREQLGLQEDGGALIGDVSAGPAQDAGIRRGDIVLMFDGKDVKNARHLSGLIEQADDKRTVAVLVRRGDSPLFMALRLRD